MRSQFVNKADNTRSDMAFNPNEVAIVVTIGEPREGRVNCNLYMNGVGHPHNVSLTPDDLNEIPCYSGIGG